MITKNNFYTEKDLEKIKDDQIKAEIKKKKKEIEGGKIIEKDGNVQK